MRKSLLPLLRCPACRAEKTIDAARVRIQDNELWDGTLQCSKCGTSFPVLHGVPDLLSETSDTVARERASYARSRIEVHERIDGLPPEGQDSELLRIASMEHTGEEFRATSRINLNGMISLMDPSPGELLLELGAGSGWLTCTWAARGVHCIATDIARDLKLELSHLLMRRENVYFERALADMTNLPFASVFDYVFVSASLHHAEDLTASLREAARVLKPGGRLVAINEPMHGFLRKSGKRFIDQAAEQDPDVHEQSFNALQWWHALRSAGLKTHYHFPPYYAEVLEKQNRCPGPSSRLKTIAGMAWKSPLRAIIGSGAVMRFLQLFLGINVCLIARKRGSVE